MYGFGYGLSKMMEGATGGAVKGTLQRMAMDQETQDRQALQDYRNKTLEQSQQRIDNEENRMKIQQHANALKVAYDISKDSPDPGTTFSSVYKTLDPQGEAPSISIKGADMTIKYPTFEITGSKDHLRQALDIISQKPEITPQVLSKLNELGLANITIPNQKAKEYKPELFIGPGGDSKWIIPGDPVPTGYKKSSDTKGGASYGKDKMIDDTRGYYNMLLKALMDPEGKWVRPGKEQEYADIMKNMNADLARIDKGERPSWLMGGPKNDPKPLERETAMEILNEAGGDKNKAREIAKQRGFTF